MLSNIDATNIPETNPYCSVRCFDDRLSEVFGMLPIVAVHFRCLRWERGAERAEQCDVCSFDIFARVVFGVRDAY